MESMMARPRWGAFPAVQVSAFLDNVASLDRQGAAGPKQLRGIPGATIVHGSSRARDAPMTNEITRKAETALTRAGTVSLERGPDRKPKTKLDIAKRHGNE